MVTNQLILWPFLGGFVCLATAIYLMAEMSRRNRGNASMIELSRTIRHGTQDFLTRKYLVLSTLIAVIFILLCLIPLYRPKVHLNWTVGLAFLMGAFFTVAAGAIGMASAVRANSRTAEAARLGGMNSALAVAIGGGAVMGLSAVGLALIGLSSALAIFRHRELHIFAFALGASLVSMFTRLSGGIYTKGADIGADFVTRAETGFADNDSRNAAVLADNVGDNIGNVAGIGTNLMESFLEALIAVMAIAMTLHTRQAPDQPFHLGLVMLPLLIGAAGAVATVIGIFYIRLSVRGNPQTVLMLAPALSGGLTLAAAWPLVGWFGASYQSELARPDSTRVGIFLALALGVVAGGLLALFSEIFTSFQYRPARRIAERSQFGTTLTILEGLGVGMRSSGILTIILAGTLALAWRQAEFYGIALAAFGMLSSVGIVVTLNAFGPIVDNAGGIAEMVRMDRSVRDIMENLHAASNTMTAMGKGFAAGSATLVALGLLLVFVKSVGLKSGALALDNPALLAGLLMGAMFPLYLGSLLLRAVCTTASAIIDEVRRQIREIPGLREGKTRPDYRRCMELATNRALRGMLLPGLLVLAAPLAIGFGLGKTVLFGFLIGALVCSLVLSFQMVNSGGAMDNAKKYIEEGYFGGKGSEAHHAARVADAVGDSFKDTVGPALTIMIKLMCVTALLITPLLK